VIILWRLHQSKSCLEEVTITPSGGAHTINSTFNSLIGNLSFLTQVDDKKEWVDQELNNTYNCTLEMKQLPLTRLSNFEASNQ